MAMICPTCERALSTSSSLSRHLRVVHKQTKNKESYNRVTKSPPGLLFKEIEQFRDWKHGVEAEDGAFFRITSTKKIRDGKKSYYICNRSGQSRIEVPQDKRKRCVKTQGTRKINSTCPARFTARFTRQGILVTDFHRSHSGHESEPIHLPIPSPEKLRIASKIAAKVPFDYILDDTRNELPPGVVSRTHLINKQDIRNIAAQFGLEQDGKTDPDEGTSLETWVSKQLACKETSSVLFYKPLGEESNGLGKDDFMLGVMTKEQKEILLKFGMNVITLDWTHGSNDYQFVMTTVLILDEYRQGLPCAFLFSNKANQTFVEMFLMAIREKVGVVTPKVFMSDMTETFYDAWRAVMGECEKRLYCSWHILRDWQKNIRIIKNQEKREEAWKRLRTLLTGTDETEFLQMLLVTIDWLCTDGSTLNFGNYFIDNFSGNYEKWAYCFRWNSGINTNMHIERYHRDLKHSNLNGKTTKRLDLFIQNLIKLVKRKFYDRLRRSIGGKVEPNLKRLRSRHDSSLSISTNNIIPSSENIWSVFSSDFLNIFEVKLINSSCTCSLICQSCETCYHRFSCSCHDYVISSNMCKHIHAVCRFLSSEENTNYNNGLVVNADEECARTCLLLDEGPSLDEVDDLCSSNDLQVTDVLHNGDVPSPYALGNEKNELQDLAQSVIQKCSSYKETRWVRECLKIMDCSLETGEITQANFPAMEKFIPMKKYNTTKEQNSITSIKAEPSNEQFLTITDEVLICDSLVPALTDDLLEIDMTGIAEEIILKS